MTVIVCYDVSTEKPGGQKRLRRIANACKDFGVRVQYSIFECKIGKREWVMLKHRLLKEFDEKKDSLRFYFVSKDDMVKTEHHGQKKPLDPTGPLIL